MPCLVFAFAAGAVIQFAGTATADEPPTSEPQISQPTEATSKSENDESIETGPARLKEGVRIVAVTNALPSSAQGESASPKERMTRWVFSWKGWDGLYLELSQRRRLGDPLQHSRELLGVTNAVLHLEQVKMTSKIGARAAVDGQDFGDSSQDYGRALLRLTGLPLFRTHPNDPGAQRLLHLGLNLNWLYSASSTVRYRTRPEGHLAPYVLDTGDRDAENAASFDLEAACVHGPLSVQGEFLLGGVENQHGGTPRFMEAARRSAGSSRARAVSTTAARAGSAASYHNTISPGWAATVWARGKFWAGSPTLI